MADITGTESANTLTGTASADTIKGLGGNDIVYGKAGDDLILGGAGHDTLYGDAGTDTIKGDAGNDVIKGGTGKAFLYGGDGNDSVFYNPTASNLADVGSYLSPTIIKGEAGTDTINVFNDAKVTVDGKQVASMTDAYMGDGGIMYMKFTEKNWDYDSPISDVGKASGFETIKFFGAGGVNFQSAFSGAPDLTVEGTAAADKFFSYYGSDTFKGGAGNDEFHLGGGTDKVISETNDADSFYFGGWGEGNATVTGVNGAGVLAGDKFYFDPYYLSNPDSQVTEVGGSTIFTMNTGETLTLVGATGLIEGVDWFV